MIPIQNIYYMLSYAFQILNEQGYKNIATEQFNNTAELMAAILEKGIVIQLKRGLGKEYISQTEALSSLRGKIDIAESIKTQSMLRKQLICTYDEFSVNSIMNRIIKSTVELLLRSNISKQRKKNLGKLMVYFSEVDLIDLHTINWNVQYNRNNQTYAPNFSMESFDAVLTSLDYQIEDYKRQLNNVNIDCERKIDAETQISNREYAKKKISEIRDAYYMAKDRYKLFCESDKAVFDLYAGQDVRNCLVEFEVIVHNVFISGHSVGVVNDPLKNSIEIIRRKIINSIRNDIGTF